MTVSRSRTSFPPHPDLFIGGVPSALCNALKILGMVLDNKFPFEQHLRPVSSSVTQKVGLLRKSLLRFLGISQSRRNVLILLVCLVWSIALLFGVLVADSHLCLLDKDLNIRFVIPGFGVDSGTDAL